MQPPSNHSLALDMFPKDPSAYLCTSSSSKSTCLNDSHLHGAIKKLCTLVINFQSIRNKFNEIEVLLDSIKPDVIIGTESWLNDKIFSLEILPNTYNVLRRDREDSFSGLLIAVKSDLQCSLMHKSITSKLLSIKLHHKKSASIIISDFYRLPNCASAQSAKCVADELHNIRINHPNCEFWFSGDLNLTDIDWSNLTIKLYQYPKSMSLEFLKSPFYCDQEQMANMPSRAIKIIDLFFTAHPSLVDKCVSIPGMGDHDAVLLDMSATP